MKRFIQTKQGFGLLSIIATVSVIAIATLSITQLMQSVNRGLSTSRASTERDRLFERLYANVTLPAALAITKTHYPSTGSYVWNCIEPSPGTADCLHNRENDFDTYDKDNRQIAGSFGNPIRYSLSGQICSAASPECPFEALTHFRFICPGNPAPTNCERAAAIDVTLTFRVAATVDRLPASTVRFGELKRTATVEIDRILAASGVSSGVVKYCGANQIMVGVDFGNQRIQCQDTTKTFYGGFYFEAVWVDVASNTKGHHCINPNPETGACTCPAGFTLNDIFVFPSPAPSPFYPYFSGPFATNDAIWARARNCFIPTTSGPTTNY